MVAWKFQRTGDGPNKGTESCRISWIRIEKSSVEIKSNSRSSMLVTTEFATIRAPQFSNRMPILSCHSRPLRKASRLLNIFPPKFACLTNLNSSQWVLQMLDLIINMMYPLEYLTLIFVVVIILFFFGQQLTQLFFFPPIQILHMKWLDE